MATSQATNQAPSIAPEAEPLKRFPPVIERALALLAGSDHSTLSSLSMGERLLLARYVRCADARAPGAPIRVSIRVLADGLRISARTVNTLKAALLANGWITSHQVQSRRRGMQICDVRLTPLAVQALQLLASLRRPSTEHEIDHAPRDGAQGSDHRSSEAHATAQPAGAAGSSAGASSPENFPGGRQVCGQPQPAPEPLDAPMATLRAKAALACRDFKEQPLQRHPAGKSLDQRQPTPAGHALAAWQLHRSPRLPRPLAWLERHMSATRVCLLMREARDRGFELETLATAARDRIDRARHPFAYLRTLVKRDSNWRPAPHPEPRRDTKARESVSRWAAEAQGLAFSSSAGLIHRVEAGVVRVYSPDEAAKPLGHSVGVMPLSPQFIADVSQGRLRPWGPSAQSARRDALPQSQ